MTRICQILIFQIHFLANSHLSEMMILVGDDPYLRQNFYLPFQNHHQAPPHLLLHIIILKVTKQRSHESLEILIRIQLQHKVQNMR